jgi:membrane protease YdiL (CAAX protease family)
MTADTGAPAGDSFARRALFGPHGLRAGWRLLLFLVIVVPLEALLGFVRRHLLHGADRSASFMVRELADFLIFVFASSMMGRLEHRTLADYGLPWRQRFRVRFWQGAAIGFGTITTLVLAMRACGVARFGGVALHGFAIVSWAALYAFAMILVALREEFRARGYALVTLASGIRFWPAAALSAAYFGWSHHGNAGESALGLVNVGLYGLVACIMLRNTGDLWLPIGFHAAFDWGESYFYGVANSGNAPFGNLLRTTPAGPAWLSGGTVGPEGSVLCTVVLLLVGIASACLIRPATEPTPPLRFPPAA